MTREALTVHPSMAVLAALGLMLAGAAATWSIMRIAGNERAAIPAAAVSDDSAQAQLPARRQGQAPAQDAAARDRQSGQPPSEVVVTLTKEAMDRAGVVVRPVRAGDSSSELRLPGVVAPNAYRQVVVTPLVSGRVTRVSVALGERVRRGQTIAEIDSPEKADVERRYIAARAELAAHDRELQRTEKLVTIGAASRQELERVHAAHTAQQAEVASARARLEQLGVPVPTVDNDNAAGTTIARGTPIIAPADGVILERQANVGLNVDMTSKLFTIVDLSTVWVVADLFERDFARARVGTEATLTTSAFPDSPAKATVAYVDPQVDPVTRTAKVRLELPNARDEWRLGMYVDVRLSGVAEPSAIVVPRGAVQTVGSRHVVYLTDSREPGRFVEREVQLGQTDAQSVQILSGLTLDDVIVTQGSFFLRAEADRLGLRQRTGGAPPAGTHASGSDASTQTIEVLVTARGFEPANVTVKRGVPASLVFRRVSDKTCATDVVIPSLKITRALPLNERVEIRLTPSGKELTFACGMNMLTGVAEVR